MTGRVLGALRLSFVGLLTLGCNDDTGPNDDDVGEGTDTSGEDTSGDGSTDTDTDSDTGEGETGDESEDGLDELPPCGERQPGGGVAGPPVLQSAVFEDDLLIRLTFSEPIASVDEVDPASFRISVGRYYEGYYEGESGYTLYEDPMAALCSFTDACSDNYTDVVEIGCAPDDPTSVLLRVDILHHEYLCPIFDDASTYGLEFEFLPHYDAAAGMITDLDGEPLESIAEHWVQSEELGAYVEGNFPDLPMRVPIPCPG